eukprot:CAMPEP_0198695058 /NCGR_PEP_ID=MMETSP1468-20131203/281323_1 /TAXON_ID=1461545 /ORGANISM="Mantoniella sp, Strain CCMP1436" /LENGTH=115 /DNA_ID=CAMNT_0044450601 /DNA_START=346 /DNA_END=694 /DNA_ORIENTATION=-
MSYKTPRSIGVSTTAAAPTTIQQHMSKLGVVLALSQRPLLPLYVNSPFSSCTSSFPSHPATTGVSATVGAKRIGDAALWAAYAIANVPNFSLFAVTVTPTFSSSPATSTPAEMSA